MTHRRDCDQPTPTETPSRAAPGLVILRCPTCDAIELRRHKPTDSLGFFGTTQG